MTASGKELRDIMKNLGVKSEGLASVLGITTASLRNIIYGQSQSRRIRQEITDLFQVQLWKDIQIRKQPLVFWDGDEIKLPTIASAKRVAQVLSAIATRRGKIVRFAKPLSMMVPGRIVSKKPTSNKKTV